MSHTYIRFKWFVIDLPSFLEMEELYRIELAYPEEWTRKFEIVIFVCMHCLSNIDRSVDNQDHKEEGHS